MDNNSKYWKIPNETTLFAFWKFFFNVLCKYLQDIFVVSETWQDYESGDKFAISINMQLCWINGGVETFMKKWTKKLINLTIILRIAV